MRTTRLVLLVFAYFASTAAFANQAPTALLFGDIDAALNDTIHLDGSDSFDPDGDPLTYEWTIRRPDGTEFNLPDTPTPSFVVDQPGDWRVLLTVFDGRLRSNDCIIRVRVKDNQRPIATAEAEFASGRTVQLTGTGMDPDGDPVTFFWTLETPAGSDAELSDPTVMNPTFVADLDGTYVGVLVVTDIHGLDSLPARAPISTSPGGNRPPIAVALPEEIEVLQGETFNLDGTNSSDPDNDPITFLWTSNRPGEGVIGDDTSATPTFTPMQTGAYILTLVVTDSFGAVSQPDTVQVLVGSDNNNQPTAAGTATPDDPYIGIDTVTLDGSESFDPDGDDLSFLWTVSGPPGSTAQPVDPTAEVTTFDPDVPGDYQIQLMVTDPGGLSATIVIPITAFEAPVIVISDVVQDEGNSFNSMVFDLSIEGTPRPGDILAVQFLTEDGTATTQGEDYILIPENPPQIRMLTPSANPAENYRAQITVNIAGDATDECHEFFVVQLQNPVNAVVAPDERGIGVGVLLDDEPPAGEDIVDENGNILIDCPTAEELRDDLLMAELIGDSFSGLGFDGVLLTTPSTGTSALSHLGLLWLGLLVVMRTYWGRKK